MAQADAEMLRALQRRARLAKQVGELGGGGSAVSERDQMGMLEGMAGEDLPAEMVRGVFREIHAATSSLERPSRVAYVAPEGGFGQVAALKQVGIGATLIPVSSSELAIDEVRRQRADLAVIPFESSVEGPLQASVEALAETDLSLGMKIEISASLSLVGKVGSTAAIEKIYAYAPDRLACRKYLDALPGKLVEETESPAAACRACLHDASGAALVPTATGEQFGVPVVEANVGDRADLRVRYGLISSRPSYRTGADTTAILFGVHDEPGALFDVLKHFAERGVNLKTIQSRPRQGDNWNYLFYIEVSGHVTDRAVVTALEALKRQTRFLKVIGSFPSC